MVGNIYVNSEDYEEQYNGKKISAANFHKILVKKG